MVVCPLRRLVPARAKEKRNWSHHALTLEVWSTSGRQQYVLRGASFVGRGATETLRGVMRLVCLGLTEGISDYFSIEV